TPLIYATGNDPANVTAKSYAVMITTTAADTTGQHLAASFASSFHTRRRIQQQALPLTVNLSGVCYGSVTVGESGRLIVRDAVNQSVYKGLASFSTAALPTGVRAFEVARLTFNYDGVEGTPFPSLGAITVEIVSFPMRSMAYDATAHGNLGTLAISAATDTG